MFSCVACMVILSGCSYEGKIVRKEFKPLPFYSALGVKGLYRFDVRCRDGQIRRQVVSANVYADYKAGDYFSDRPQQISSPAAPAEGPPPSVPARFMIMLALRPLQQYGPHYASIPTAWVEPAASLSNDHVIEGQEVTRVPTSHSAVSQ
jgi:hypothetical protein